MSFLGSFASCSPPTFAPVLARRPPVLRPPLTPPGRRRKTRCHFDSQSDAVCAGCKARGTSCTSQEYDDEDTPARVPHDRRVAQRLSRLEALMETLVEQVRPASEGSGSSARMGSLSGSASVSASEGPRFSESDGGYTPATSLDGWDPPAGGTPSTGKLCAVRDALLEVYPSDHDVGVILSDPTGIKMSQGISYTHHEMSTNRSESPHTITQRPAPDAHPVLLAKRLLQFSLCLLHLPRSPGPTLDAGRSAPQLAAEYVSTVARLVCGDDELVCCAEGLEVLLLHALCQAAAGNLRKAWLAARRALSLGELMGASRPGRLAALPSCEGSDPATRPLPAVLWFHINYQERHLSLLLGLATASRDDGIRGLASAARLSPGEKMEVAHGLLTRRIIERNLSTEEGYEATLAVDLELRRAAAEMPPGWWTAPVADPGGARASDDPMGDAGALKVQTRHYGLLIMLHLPYVIRGAADPRFSYSRTSCLSASREALKRYTSFRALQSQSVSCRHMDYYALVASMTLILGYLGPGANSSGGREKRLEDRCLVDGVRAMMAAQAVEAGDRMTGEAAEVVGGLMPIIDRGVGSCAEARDAVRRGLRLRIPYLGTVSIGESIGKGVADGIVEEGGQCPQKESACTGAMGEWQGSGDVAETYYGDPALSLSLDTDFVNPSVLGEGQGMGASSLGIPLDDQGLLGMSGQGVMQPGLTADGEDWSFQGVDTAYWSLLNGAFL